MVARFWREITWACNIFQIESRSPFAFTQWHSVAQVAGSRKASSSIWRTTSRKPARRLYTSFQAGSRDPKWHKHPNNSHLVMVFSQSNFIFYFLVIYWYYVSVGFPTGLEPHQSVGCWLLRVRRNRRLDILDGKNKMVLISDIIQRYHKSSKMRCRGHGVKTFNFWKPSPNVIQKSSKSPANKLQHLVLRSGSRGTSTADGNPNLRVPRWPRSCQASICQV